MKTPTISDIAWMTSETSPHYFDRDTLKFFGQTMGSFKVRKSPKGKIFIFAPGKYGTWSFRQYVPSKIVGKAQLRIIPRSSMFKLREIESYIRNH